MARLAKAYISLGDLTSARSIPENVYTQRLELLGTDDSSTIWAANDYANTLQKLGHLDMARSIQQDNLAVVERSTRETTKGSGLMAFGRICETFSSRLGISTRMSGPGSDEH